jgi:hypothetical protein
MRTEMWMMMLFVFVAGGVGGTVNALMTDNGFVKPKREPASAGGTVFRAGWLGNAFVGAIAALISWGLYGPLGALMLYGTTAALAKNASPETVGLSLAALVGAILVGIGGARWLSNEVDKDLLRATAVAAAGKPASSEASQQIAMAKPAQALKVAMSMK